MTITTKFDFGEKVWFIKNSKANVGTIEHIVIRVANRIPNISHSQKTETSIMYFLTTNGAQAFYENEVFKSKEELIKSLETND